MKKLLINPLIGSRYLLAIVAGLLLAAAFPKLGIAGLAWVAPGLMAAAALDRKGWESFRIGYVSGLAYYLASLYWLLLIPYRWHGIPFGPAAAWLALSAYCSLYPATWVWWVNSVRSPKSKLQSPDAPEAERLTRPSSTGGSWWRRTRWALSGAAVWVAWEMTISRLMSGFPWDMLGASQYQMLPLIQVASLTGVYGVSFLLVWVSLSLVSAALAMLRRPSARWVWMGEILLPLGVTLCIFNFGLAQLRKSQSAERFLKVTMIQPSIPQTLIWDTSRDDERFRELMQLSEQALTNQTDLLLWPEAAVPKLLRYEKEVFESVTGLARKHRVWMIIGADDAEPRPPGTGKRADFYNSSFLISPEGELVGRYRKRSLVIFGEYIPLVRWLPFLKWFTPIEGGFTRGDGPTPFELTDLNVKTSVLICFEDIFPHWAREYVDPDTDFLVNLTNNGWFGEGAAQWQHATSGFFRAVENGLPLVRCCNNGLTCWVDSRGRLQQVFRDAKADVYGSGFLRSEIPLLGPEQNRPPTFYRRYGDWLGWGCVLVTVAGFGLKWMGRSKKPATA